MNTLKAALAFAVILEFGALAAFEWPGTGQTHAAQPNEPNRVAVYARSVPMADRVEYAPCGMLGEPYVCSP